MRKLRIAFLARSFGAQSTSCIPLVMRALTEEGVVVDLIHPLAGVTDLSKVRPNHDLYVLHQTSGFALSLAGALHAQGAAIVNPYPVSLALSDKIVLCRILQAAGVRIPATLMAYGAEAGAIVTAIPVLQDGYARLGKKLRSRWRTRAARQART